MRVRVLLEPRFGASYDQLRAMARTAEEAGFDAFFRSDHLLGADPEDPYHPTDSWTTLAGLARDTSHIRLGTLVTACTFRAPGMLAATVATVDEMSGGRIELGLGAGWYEREHEAYGVPFPGLGGRFDRLEEQLAIVTGLWATPRGQAFDFEGRCYRLADNRSSPTTVQGPPPVIVGGAGPRRTPALAARFADEYNGTLPGGLRERFDVVDRACEAIGRDPATLRRSVVVPVACGRGDDEAGRRATFVGSPRLREATVAGTPDVIVETLNALAGDGADTAYLHLFDVTDLDHLQLLGEEVVPEVANLEPQRRVRESAS